MKEDTSVNLPDPKRVKTTATIIEESCNDTNNNDNDIINEAWEHYRNFLDSAQENDDEGDVDELHELILLLEKKKEEIEKYSHDSVDKIQTKKDLIPILLSVAHYHLANHVITNSVDQKMQDDNDDDKNIHNQVKKHLQKSIKHFPYNAATWSMGSNYVRMNNSCLQVSSERIASWYMRAAKDAKTVRFAALQILESTELEDESIKEWVELLLMDGVVDSEFIVVEQQDEKCEKDENLEQGDKDDEAEDEDDDDGYFGPSAVEATSRFMASMLLSTLGKHNDVLENLQQFDLTHRLHPNVWNGGRSYQKAEAAARSDNTATPVYLFEKDPILPTSLYEEMCQLFGPSSCYWEESDYAHRGYYSYFMDIHDKHTPTNLLEDVIYSCLLPRAQQVLSSDTNKKKKKKTKIVGAEWWAHTRPMGGTNLGHNLHFDTDESLLEQEGIVTHPILSSVLYLTTGSGQQQQQQAGSTIIFNQTPDSKQVADKCWSYPNPKENTMLLFDGTLLHGVLPCPPTSDDESTTTSSSSFTTDNIVLDWNNNTNSNCSKQENTHHHRLTFMVGFWTRRVPDKMKNPTKLYGPCSPLPPSTTARWVQMACKGYPKVTKTTSSDALVEEHKKWTHPPCCCSPAWEEIMKLPTTTHDNNSREEEQQQGRPLSLPHAIDHRFFVKGAPECFRESLFENDHDDDDG